MKRRFLFAAGAATVGTAVTKLMTPVASAISVSFPQFLPSALAARQIKPWPAEFDSELEVVTMKEGASGIQRFFGLRTFPSSTGPLLVKAAMEAGVKEYSVAAGNLILDDDPRAAGIVDGQYEDDVDLAIVSPHNAALAFTQAPLKGTIVGIEYRPAILDDDWRDHDGASYIFPA